VFTGVSGSGKSSLVFSTIAAESQRLIGCYGAFRAKQKLLLLAVLRQAPIRPA
jgi:excinuclease UvrABC ATPase subunit